MAIQRSNLDDLLASLDTENHVLVFGDNSVHVVMKFNNPEAARRVYQLIDTELKLGGLGLHLGNTNRKILA